MGCGRIPAPAPVEPAAKREIRLTGAMEAVHSTRIVVPNFQIGDFARAGQVVAMKPSEISPIEALRYE